MLADADLGFVHQVLSFTRVGNSGILTSIESYHWHIEILPQVFHITGFEWASGFFYNPVPPEAAARYLSPHPVPDLSDHFKTGQPRILSGT